MTASKYAVLSLSGGLDSTSLLIHLLAKYDKVFAVSFNYGQKHNIELTRVARNIDYLASHLKTTGRFDYQSIDISFIANLFHSNLLQGGDKIPEGHYAEENMKQTVVPNRNAIFASILYGYALSLSNKFHLENAVKLSLGVHSGDHAIYPDCTPQFYNQIYSAFASGNWESQKVKLYLPYLKGNKSTILQDLVKNCAVLDLSLMTILKNTNTCYNPDLLGKSCGKCGSCVERVEAFIELKMKDPVIYVKPWEEIVESVKEVLKSKSNNG